MPIDEAILYFCEDCKTVSLQGGVCANCEKTMQVEFFVPKGEKMTEDFEILSDEVVLIDGKYYRAMSDKDAAEFIWSEPETRPTKRAVDTATPSDNVAVLHKKSSGKRGSVA